MKPRLLFAVLMCSFFLLPRGAFADAGQSPLTPPKSVFQTNNGEPASGYKVCTYAAGTTTPLATYIAFGTSSTNTNPVILDSAGRANIWLGSADYKIVLMTPGTDHTCATGSVVTSTDNVAGFCKLSGCTFSSPIAINVSSAVTGLAVNGVPTTGVAVITGATAATGGSFFASGGGGTIGLEGLANSATGTGLLAENDSLSGTIFTAKNSIATKFQITTAATTVSNALIAPSIAVNGGTAITAQSGTGGTVAMTAGPTFTGTISGAAESLTGQLTSTLATGTAPLVIASTTPVANLTTSPAAYNPTGTQQTNTHIVYGEGALVSGTPSTVTITLTGAAVFTSNITYRCGIANETTAANGIKFSPLTGSTFSLTGPNTVSDAVSFVCVGN